MMGSAQPTNLMYIDDAATPEEVESFRLMRPNVFLTKSNEGEENLINEYDDNDSIMNMNSGLSKKKVTLNLRLPKHKLKALKHIAAIIQTRDPKTNAMVTKIKKYKVGYLTKNVKRSGQGRLNRALFLSTIFKSGSQSVGNRSMVNHDFSANLSTRIHNTSTDIHSGFPRIEKIKEENDAYLKGLKSSKNLLRGFRALSKRLMAILLDLP